MNSETSEVNPPAIPRWEWITLLVIVALAGVLRLYRPELAYYNLHVGRDLYRALETLHFERIHLLGSEMQYGGRVFGPLVYFLYAVPLAFAKSPYSVGIFIGLINTALIAWVWSFARTALGPIAALGAAALYATFPLEVVQLRYLWNPCFLPLMVFGMYFTLWRWVAGGSPWWLVLTTVFFHFAFQLHFSVLMTLPGLLLVGFLARRRPPLQVIAAMAVVFLLLSAPFLWAEFRLRIGNTAEAIRAPVARDSFAERHQFNPTAWINLRHIITSDWNEAPERLGFTYLWFLREQSLRGEAMVHALRSLLLLTATLLQALLWVVGAWTLIRRIRGMKSAADRREGLLAVLLLCWQFAPIPFLSFFNYHQMQEGHTSIVPLRYYLITYPAAFLIAGVGAQALWARFRRTLLAIMAYLTVAHIAVVVAYLNLLATTGIGLPYLRYHAPTLERLLQLREVLLEDLKINIDDYYDRLTGQNVLLDYTGEVSIDFLMSQDPRSYSNPGLGPNRQVIVWAPEHPTITPPEAEPRLVEPMKDGAPEVRVAHRQVGLLHVLVYEGTPSGQHPFDPVQKRNFYYRQERMKFLDWSSD